MLVYTLIVGRVLETFMPPCKVEYTTVDAVCAARKFRIRTYRILEKGWLGIFEREHIVAKGRMPYQVMPEFFQEEILPVKGKLRGKAYLFLSQNAKYRDFTPRFECRSFEDLQAPGASGN